MTTIVILFSCKTSIVHTAETTKIGYFINLLIQKKKSVMLVGPAGCGKTLLMNNKLSNLPEDEYGVTNMCFNYYTTSGKQIETSSSSLSTRRSHITFCTALTELLQKVLEKPLEKKAGRNYGPVGNKTMIYFLDDLNIPQVKQYHC